MKVQVSYYTGLPGVLHAPAESTLEAMACELGGSLISIDWTMEFGPVYRQLVFEVPGGNELGSLAGRFCRRACEYLEFRGFAEPRFGIVTG